MSPIRIRCASHRRRGFTLLDAAATVMVVGVLVTLLVPALDAARTAAVSIACSQNQHQIAIAGAQYTADFSGRMPGTAKVAAGTYDPITQAVQKSRREDPGLNPGDTLNGIPGSLTGGIYYPWQAYLNAYVGSLDTWICPSNADVIAQRRGDPNTEEGDVDANYYTSFMWWLSYGRNSHMYGSWTGGHYVIPDLIQQRGDIASVLCYGGYIGGSPLNAGSHVFGYLPGMFAEPTTAVPHPMLMASPDFLDDATSQRHPNVSVNTLYFDGSVRSVGVRSIHDPDLGGVYGVANTGITEAGNLYWGRTVYPNSTALRQIRTQQ
jgi:prepilin-type processing-associated H-X9-DG protein